MASIMYDIGFRVDSASLNSALSGIQKDLENLGTNNTFNNNLKQATQQGKELSAELAKGVDNIGALRDKTNLSSKTLNEATRAAKTLDAALRKATTNKGLSLSTLKASLNEAGYSVSSMVKSLSDGRMDGSLNTFLSQLSQAKSRTVSLNGEIGKFIDSLKNSLKYNIANTIWRGVTTQFQAAISYAKDIDKSLTDIAMVSNEAAANLDKVLSNAKAGANELGVRTRDYLDAATLFYQMSFDDEDQMEAVQKRTDITLRAAKAAGEDVGTMASNLTAVWQTFDLKGEELERVAAIASRLGADSAIAFKDIVEGMRNSGQAAAELGLDYERLMAIVTTVGDVTQKSASTIDNSFKTMFARMVDLKKGGPGAVDEDGIGLGNISKQLAELGFSPLDSFTGELKDLNTIIDELGGSWDELTDKERINIAQVIGGKRQYTDFLTLMNNFDKYEGFLSSAMNEDGSSLEAQSMLYQDSLEAIQNRAANSWKDAMSNLITPDLLKTLAKMSNVAGDLFGGITNGMGGIFGALTLFTDLLVQRSMPEITAFGNNLQDSLKDNKVHMQAFAKGVATLGEEFSSNGDKSLGFFDKLSKGANAATQEYNKLTLARNAEARDRDLGDAYKEVGGLLPQNLQKDENGLSGITVNTKRRAAQIAELVEAQQNAEKLREIEEQGLLDTEAALGQRIKAEEAAVNQQRAIDAEKQSVAETSFGVEVGIYQQELADLAAYNKEKDQLDTDRAIKAGQVVDTEEKIAAKELEIAEASAKKQTAAFKSPQWKAYAETQKQREQELADLQSYKDGLISQIDGIDQAKKELVKPQPAAQPAAQLAAQEPYIFTPTEDYTQNMTAEERKAFWDGIFAADTAGAERLSETNIPIPVSDTAILNMTAEERKAYWDSISAVDTTGAEQLSKTNVSAPLDNSDTLDEAVAAVVASQKEKAVAVEQANAEIQNSEEGLRDALNQDGTNLFSNLVEDKKEEAEQLADINSQEAENEFERDGLLTQAGVDNLFSGLVGAKKEEKTEIDQLDTEIENREAEHDDLLNQDGTNLTSGLIEAKEKEGDALEKVNQREIESQKERDAALANNSAPTPQSSSIETPAAPSSNVTPTANTASIISAVVEEREALLKITEDYDNKTSASMEKYNGEVEAIDNNLIQIRQQFQKQTEMLLLEETRDNIDHTEELAAIEEQEIKVMEEAEVEKARVEKNAVARQRRYDQQYKESQEKLKLYGESMGKVPDQAPNAAPVQFSDSSSMKASVDAFMGYEQDLKKVQDNVISTEEIYNERLADLEKQKDSLPQSEYESKKAKLIYKMGAAVERAQNGVIKAEEDYTEKISELQKTINSTAAEATPTVQEAPLPLTVANIPNIDMTQVNAAQKTALDQAIADRSDYQSQLEALNSKELASQQTADQSLVSEKQNLESELKMVQDKLQTMKDQDLAYTEANAAKEKAIAAAQTEDQRKQLEMEQQQLGIKQQNILSRRSGVDSKFALENYEGSLQNQIKDVDRKIAVDIELNPKVDVPAFTEAEKAMQTDLREKVGNLDTRIEQLKVDIDPNINPEELNDAQKEIIDKLTSEPVEVPVTADTTPKADKTDTTTKPPEDTFKIPGEEDYLRQKLTWTREIAGANDKITLALKSSTQAESEQLGVLQSTINHRQEELNILLDQNKAIVTRGEELSKQVLNSASREGAPEQETKAASEAKELEIAAAELQRAMGEISKVQMENPDLVAMEDVLEETGFSADKLNKILEKLGSKTSLNDLMQGGTSTSTVMEEMSYIAQDGATKIDALASSSEKAAQKATDHADRLREEADAIREEGTATEEQIARAEARARAAEEEAASIELGASQVRSSQGNYDSLTESINGTAATMGKISQESNQQVNDLLNLDEQLEKTTGHLGKFAAEKAKIAEAKASGDLGFGTMLSSATGVISSLTRVTGAINGITNAWSVLNDKDASWGKKIMTLVPAIVGAITAIAGVYTALTKTVTVGSVEMSVAVMAIPIIGWVIGITAAVIALVVVFNKWKASTPEAKLKATQEESAKLKEALEETTKRAKELHDSFSNYDDAVDALKKCRKGTDEWRQALEKVNDAALDILTTYPDIAKMDGIITRNKDGMLEFNQELLDQALATADQAVVTAKAANLMGQARVSQAQLDVKDNDAYKKINLGAGNDYSTGGQEGTYDYEASWAQEKAYAEISKSATELSQMTADEYKAAVTEIVQKQTDMSEEAQQNLINSAIEFRSSIDDLGSAAQGVANQISNYTKMIVADQLEGKGFSPEAEAIAGQQYQKNFEEQSANLYAQYTGSGISKTSGKDNQIVVDMLADLNKATGENLVMDQNAVRGTDGNRSFAFRDAQGKEKILNAQQVADTIAASKALEMVTGSAEDASKELNKLQDSVDVLPKSEQGARQAGVDAIKTTIAGGNFEGLTKGEFNTLNDQVVEAGGTKDYLTEMAGSLGFKDEDGAADLEAMATAYGFESAEKFVNAFQKNLNVDWDDVGLFDGDSKKAAKQAEETANAYNTALNRLKSKGITEDGPRETSSVENIVGGQSTGEQIELEFSTTMHGQELNEDTLKSYISEITSQASALAQEEGISMDEALLKLDSEGIEIDGQIIKDVYAGVEGQLGELEQAAIDAKDGLQTALENSDVKLTGFDNISHEAAAAIQKSFDGANLGAMGSAGGQAYIDGLNGILDQVDPDNQAAVLEGLATVDWTSFDGGAKEAKGVMAELGITINESDPAWKKMIENMRIANNASPVKGFNELVGTMQELTKLTSKLKIGDSMSEADYQKLLAINPELEKYFMLQADGSHKVLGGVDEMKNLGIEDQIKGLKDYAKAYEDLEGLNWNIGGADLNWGKLAEQGDSYAALEGTFNNMNVAGSKTREIMQEVFHYSDEALQEIADGFAEGGDAAEISRQKVKEIASQMQGLEEAGENNGYTQMIEEMLASSAESIPQLEAMLKDGTIGIEAFSKAYHAMNAEAELAGLNADEVNEYGNYLQDAAADADDLADSLKFDPKTADQLATSIMRLNRGVESLNKGFKDWSSVLTKSKSSSKEYADAMSGIKNAMADVLGVSKDWVSNDFIKKNMKDIELAADGSAEAIDRLKKAATLDILTQTFKINLDLDDSAAEAKAQSAVDKIQGLLDARPTSLLMGASIDDKDFVAATQQMIHDGKMTADQVNAAFSAMGFEVEYETESVPQEKEGHGVVTTTVPSSQTLDIQNPDGSISKIPAGYETFTTAGTPYKYTDYVDMIAMETNAKGEKTDIPKIKGVHKMATGASNNSSSSNPGGKGGGGGGGSKGSKPPKAASKVKEVDYTKRYEDIESAIDETTNAMNKFSKASDHAFGTTKLALMDKERKEIEQLGSEYKSLYDEASNYYKADVAAAKTLDKETTAALKKLKSKVSTAKIEPPKIDFLKDGTIANPEEIKKFWTQAANDALIPYNKLLEEQKALLEKIGDVEEVKPDDQKELDRIAKEMEAEKELADSINEVSEAELKKVEQAQETAKKMQEVLEKQIDLIRTWLTKELAAIQYKIDVRVAINDRDIAIFDMLMDHLGDKAQTTAKKMSMIFSQADSGVSNMKAVLEGANKTMDLMKNINDPANQAKFKAIYGPEAWAEFQKDGALPQEVIDQLDGSVDALMSEIQNMYARNDEIWASYLNAMENYISQFDDLLSGFDNHADMLDSYLNIWQKSGKAFKDPTTSLMLLNKQVDNAGDKLEGLKSKYDYVAAAAATATQGYQQGVASGLDEESLTKLKDQMVKANKLAEESHRDFLGEVSSYLDKVAQAEADAATEIARAWGESLGGLFSGLGTAMDMYNQKKTIEDFYLTDQNKVYELGQMAREVTKYMEKMTDPEMLEKYGGILDNITAKEGDGLKITKESLDIMKAQLDLEMLKDKYKEQQEAKNTMRLARDASGNWSYNYSTDDSGKSEDLAGKIEEAQHNIDEMERLAADKFGESWLQLQVEYNQFIEGVDQLMYENNEKYRAEVDTRMADYITLSDMYKEEVILHNNAIDRSFSDTTLGVVTDFDDMELANQSYKADHESLWQSLRSNHNDFQAKANETMNNVGMSMETLEDTTRTETDQMMKENNDLKNTIDNLKTEAIGDMSEIMNMQSIWASEWNAKINGMIADCMRMIDALRLLKAEQAGGGGQGYLDDTQYGLAVTSYIAEKKANHVSDSDLAKDETLKALFEQEQTKGKTDEFKKWATDTSSLDEIIKRTSASITDAVKIDKNNATTTAVAYGLDADTAKKLQDYTKTQKDQVSMTDALKAIGKDDKSIQIVAEKMVKYGESTGAAAKELSDSINELARIKADAASGSIFGDKAANITTELQADKNGNIKVPALATGGYVQKPTLALVGEAGPELILNAGQVKDLTELLKQNQLSQLLNMQDKYTNIVKPKTQEDINLAKTGWAQIQEDWSTFLAGVDNLMYESNSKYRADVDAQSAAFQRASNSQTNEVLTLTEVVKQIKAAQTARIYQDPYIGIANQYSQEEIFGKETMNKFSDQWLQLQTDFSNFISNVDQKRYNTDERYKLEVDTQKEMFNQQSLLEADKVNRLIGTVSNLASLGQAVQQPQDLKPSPVLSSLSQKVQDIQKATNLSKATTTTAGIASSTVSMPTVQKLISSQAGATSEELEHLNSDYGKFLSGVDSTRYKDDELYRRNIDAQTQRFKQSTALLIDEMNSLVNSLAPLKTLAQPANLSSSTQAYSAIEKLMPSKLEVAVKPPENFDYIGELKSKFAGSDQAKKIEQSVVIQADFPSVSQSNEIEEAFNNLVNRAVQYAMK